MVGSRISCTSSSLGSLTKSIVSAREVFEAAILGNAAELIRFHNLPSGDPTPGAEDRAVTRRLVQVGTLPRISVLDHLILDDRGDFVSFHDKGWI